LEGYQIEKDIYDLDLFGGDILMLGLTTILYFSILLFIELNNFNINFNDKKKLNIKLEQDVQAEA